MTGHAGETIVGAVRARAGAEPERIAFRFLADLGETVAELDFGELDGDARRVAAALREAARPGDRAAIVYTSERAFVRAFFGCLYAGVLAVPIAVPPPRRGDDTLRAILADCRPAAVLTHGRILATARARIDAFGGFAGLAWLDVDAIAASGIDAPPAAAPRPERAAYLQYTSGSTTAPRGVVVSHRSLLANCRGMQAAFGFDRENLRALAWVPLYHDMGLVGHVAVPALLGCPSTLLPPNDFLQRPGLWLRAIAAFGATFTMAPNFAYDLCAARISDDEAAALDLSGLRWAVIGTEQVRLATMRRFAERLAPSGFRIERFAPCYGLAETTLMATGRIDRGAPVAVRASRAALLDDRVVEVADAEAAAVDVVSNGRPIHNSTLCVVAPDTGRAAPAGAIGEVWIRGESLGDGYWGRPEETVAVFRARCADDGREYLRTGDLGFLRGGELYLCGRLKDVVVLDGKNHHAHDLEQALAGCHPALRENAAAAFAVDVGERERLVCACEIRREALRDLDRAAVVAAMRRALAERHGVALHDAALLRPGRLPRTTSGKVMRRACRRMYLEGALATIGGGDGR